MRRYIYVIFALVTLGAFIAVFALRSDVSKIFEGVSSHDQSSEATLLAIQELHQLQDPSLYFQLSKSDFLQFLAPVIEEKLSRITLEKGDILNISDIKYDFGKQGISLDINFVAQVDSYNVSLAGNLRGVITAYFENGNVKLLPSITGGKISSGRHWSWRSKFTAKLVDGVISQLSSQLNAVAFSDPIDLELNFDSIVLITDENIADIDGLSVSNDIRKIELDLKRAAIRINKDGLALLAQFDDGFKAAIDSTVDVEPAALKSNDFDYNFDLLNDAFTSTYQAAFPAFTASSGALIAKGFISQRMNAFLGASNSDILRIETRAPDVIHHFSAHPQLYKKEDVRCGDLKQNCEAKRKSCENRSSCSNSRSCAGSSCARNCSKYDFYCKSKAEICRATERTKAEACRVTARAEAEACRAKERVKAEVCRAGQDLEVKNCKLNNEVKVAACKTELETLRVVEDFLDIGEIDGTVQVSNISTDISVTGIKFAPDLSQVEIVSNIALVADLAVDLTLNPEGVVGHIVCLWSEKPSLRSPVAVLENDYSVRGDIKFEIADGGAVLRGQVTAVGDPVMITVRPSPWDSLTKDKGFALSCTVAEFALGAGGLLDMIGLVNLPEEAKALITGRYTYSNIGFEFDFSLGAMSVKVGSEALTIFPRVDAQTIQFLVQ
ncbi:hypothetical protein [Sulfitobacter sp. R86518]|uniref:hypothetical protein n=1 Tax=Sulfitobacter sp. R86518 TaxID=3093858 RepID=UPI0036D90A61